MTIKPLKRIGLAENTQALLSCYLMHMLVPLLPFILEWWWRPDGLTPTTAALTVAMYAIAIGISSRSQAIFSLCLVLGILFSVLFGMISSNLELKIPYIMESSVIALIFVIIVHGCERFNKHYIEREPFWLFHSTRDAEEEDV